MMLRQFARSVPAWDAPAKMSLLMAIVLLVACWLLDSMDQSKFKCPRGLAHSACY